MALSDAKRDVERGKGREEAKQNKSESGVLSRASVVIDKSPQAASSLIAASRRGHGIICPSQAKSKRKASCKSKNKDDRSDERERKSNERKHIEEGEVKRK